MKPAKPLDTVSEKVQSYRPVPYLYESTVAKQVTMLDTLLLKEAVAFGKRRDGCEMLMDSREKSWKAIHSLATLEVKQCLVPGPHDRPLQSWKENLSALRPGATKHGINPGVLPR